MANELDQSAEGTGTSAEAPPSNSGGADIEAIVAALKGDLDKRFSGIVSLVDQKVSPLASQLAELKTAGMSPEEREQLEEDALKARNAELERKLALMELRKESPDEVDFLVALESAGSFEDQLALVKQHLGPKAAAQVEAAVEAAGDPATPAIDPTNPARGSQQGISAALDSGQMNEQIADSLLEASRSRSLASFRRPQE